MGLTTQQEMCLAFVAYWPKLPGQNEGCISLDDPQAGISGLCGITPFMGYEPPDYEDYTKPNCTHIPLDPEQTMPLLMTEFDPTLYNRSQYLDPDEKFKLYWSIDRDQGIIHGAVEVATTGWAGYGLSSFGMIGADVFIAWVDVDGNPHFADRFATAYARPPIDEFQDYFDVRLMRTESSSSSSSSSNTIENISSGTVLRLAFVVSVIIIGFMGICCPNIFTHFKFLR